MIIFDLDGTLADCEHRRHFVDRLKDHPDYYREPCKSCNDGSHHKIDPQIHKVTKELWQPDWPAFDEACDEDISIQPVLDAFIHLTQGEPFNHDVRIWSGRCESVREKTLNWLVNLTGYLEDKMYWDRRLKMRPIGDSTPDDELKERWLDETIRENRTVDFVFDRNTKSIAMWRRRGIFVFNCCQHDNEF